MLKCQSYIWHYAVKHISNWSILYLPCKWNISGIFFHTVIQMPFSSIGLLFCSARLNASALTRYNKDTSYADCPSVWFSAHCIESVLLLLQVVTLNAWLFHLMMYFSNDKGQLYVYLYERIFHEGFHVTEIKNLTRAFAVFILNIRLDIQT